MLIWYAVEVVLVDLEVIGELMVISLVYFRRNGFVFSVKK